MAGNPGPAPFANIVLPFAFTRRQPPVTPLDNRPWYQQLSVRTGVLLPVKAVGTMAFMALFFVAYFAVLHHPLTEPVTIPLTRVDRWVDFTPAAFPAYVSLWVYVALPPAFLTGLPSLLRFTGWIAALCLFCLAIFWLFPTQVPAAAIDFTRFPGMAILKGVDAGGNACPSLHVATAVFAAFWFDRLWTAVSAPALLRWATATHCLLILWSTMAIRQHAFLDVLAGALVGWAFAWLSLRHVSLAARPGEIQVRRPSR